jgi:hypothetical protein
MGVSRNGIIILTATVIFILGFSSVVSAAVVFIQPSYANETLGSVDDLVTVTARSDNGAATYANFTWRYPNGSIARISGMIPSAPSVDTSDSFTVIEVGVWIIEVQFYNPAQNPIGGESNSTNFKVGYKIEISASPIIIPNDGTTNSTITVNVTNSVGSPVANNVVNFTTNLGNLSNGTVSGVTTLIATTDSNGLAVVNLSSTTSGTATVTAVEEEGSITLVDVAVGVNYIILSANPESILADGISNSTITANVTDSKGKAVRNKIVTFTTTLGTLSNGTVSGVTTLTLKTDTNGLAAVTLTSSATPGTATVTAEESDGGTDSITVSMSSMSTFSDGNFDISQDKFPNGQTVYVKALGLDNKKSYKFKWYYPNGTLARESAWLTGSTNQTNIWALPSDAPESTSWKIVLVQQTGGGGEEAVGEEFFTVVSQATITLSPTTPIAGQQINATATTQANPSGAMSANFTWIYPNGSIATSVISTVVGQQANDSFTTNTGGIWTLNVTFRNANNNTIDVNSTSFTVTDPPPDITGVAASPDPQFVNNTVNITANVTDNLGVSTVRTEITLPNSSVYNYTMTKNGGNLWYYEYNTTLNGTHNYTIYANDTNNNWNSSTGRNFTVSACSVAIGLSYSAINWNIPSLPAINQSAQGNNGSDITEYNVSIIASSGCAADLYIKADGDLTSGLDTIGLGNETYRYNTTNSTVPGATYTPLDTDYTGNQIGSNLGNGAYSYLKFFLSVPSGQPAGNYNNTVSIKGVKSGT